MPTATDDHKPGKYLPATSLCDGHDGEGPGDEPAEVEGDKERRRPRGEPEDFGEANVELVRKFFREVQELGDDSRNRDRPKKRCLLGSGRRALNREYERNDKSEREARGADDDFEAVSLIRPR
jgi:hypothetical protein